MKDIKYPEKILISGLLTLVVLSFGVLMIYFSIISYVFLSLICIFGIGLMIYQVLFPDGPYNG